MEVYPNTYYDGEPVQPHHIPAIAEEWNLPPDIVYEVMARFASKLPIDPSAFPADDEVRQTIAELESTLAREPNAGGFEDISVAPQLPSAKDVGNRELVVALLSGVTNTISDHFILLSDGQVAINPDNPPSVKQGYEVVVKILEAREVGSRVDDLSTWLLGSTINQLEGYHGEDFNFSQVCEQTSKSYNTVITASAVEKAFRGSERYKLSFTHHKEAFYSKIPEGDKRMVLKKAEQLGLGAKQVRGLCSICKTEGGHEAVRSVRSAEQADDLIAAYRENKIEYIIKEGNKWKKIKTLSKEAPQGDIVINLKEATVRTGGKEFPIVRAQS
jgi:hypothetical protein